MHGTWATTTRLQVSAGPSASSDSRPALRRPQHPWRLHDLSSVLGVVLPGSHFASPAAGGLHDQAHRPRDIAGIVRDILAGVIRGISVGYRVHRYEV